MKKFEIIGNYTAKDAAFAAVQGEGALPVLVCNELQLITKSKCTKSGKVKSYPIKALCCRATLNSSAYKGRYIIVDKAFKRLSKKQQIALLLRENLLELESLPVTENGTIGFTSETEKAAVNAAVMAVVKPGAANSAFMKAEKVINTSAKKAVCKSGEYRRNKKAKYGAAQAIAAAIASAEDMEELSEIFDGIPEEDIISVGAEIFDANIEEAEAASTPSEAEPEQPVQEVVAETETVEVAATEQPQTAPENPKPQPKKGNGKKK